MSAMATRTPYKPMAGRHTAAAGATSPTEPRPPARDGTSAQQTARPAPHTPAARGRSGGKPGGKSEAWPPSGPIVPAATVAGRSLALVIAIMTYLACLTVGAVSIVAETAANWQSAVASEVTIQIRPLGGLDTAGQAERAADLARGLPGIQDARILEEAENARLLEPWLGAGLDLTDLPVPRLVVLTVTPGGAPDMGELRARLAEIRGASLDDHRVWQDRLRAMARTFVVLGLGILALVMVATILTVVFATRGAMASNRDIVSVLDFVGASQAYIARAFQRHFLVLGLKGGLAGGALALLTFLVAHWFLGRFSQSASAAQLDLIFGGFAIGPLGYAGAGLVVALIALLTAATSRIAVLRALRRGDERS